MAIDPTDMITSNSISARNPYSSLKEAHYDGYGDQDASPFLSPRANFSTPPGNSILARPQPPHPTALQQHVSFWDQDGDSIITPVDIYLGFRSLGFCIAFSILALLIPVFFSYPTRLAHSYIPDPFFRIYTSSIHKAKHGSDTGVYDSDGHVRLLLFDELFARFDRSGTGSLGSRELWDLVRKDRVAADPAGWSFAMMEWSTTWLLLQRDGRVEKEDLRAIYDGSLFWRIREEEKGSGWGKGYGWKEFYQRPWDFFDHVTGGR